MEVGSKYQTTQSESYFGWTEDGLTLLHEAKMANKKTAKSCLGILILEVNKNMVCHIKHEQEL